MDGPQQPVQSANLIASQAKKHKAMVKKRNSEIGTMFALLLLYFFFDLLTREFLFDLTLPHLKLISQNRMPWMNKIADILSEMADKYGMIVIVGSSYQIMDTSKAFLVNIVVFTALGVVSILKSYYHEARPFFVTDVQPIKCVFEYGNPSGHSISSMSLYLTLWDILSRRYHATYQAKVGSLLFTLFIIFAVACSRIYNGVHTYNQILSGWIFGVAIYWLYNHILYKEITIYIKLIQNKNWHQLLWNKGTKIFYMIVFLANLNFWVGDIIHPVPKEWMAQIKQNCPSYPEIIPEVENFVRFNLAITLAGSYLGLIVEHKFMDTHQYQLHFKTTQLTTISRTILTYVLGLPIICPVFLFPKYGYNYLVTMVLRTVLPVFLGNFFLYSVSKSINLRLGLINIQVQEEVDKSSDNPSEITDIKTQ